MAIISTDVDDHYWVVTDSDQREDGKFEINLKQVADFQGTSLNVRPAIRKMVVRNQTAPNGTIVKITDTITLDRTFTVNPTS